MNLRKPLEAGGRGLLATLDPDKEFLPIPGYEAAHDIGRWWDAVLRLEEVIGLEIPAQLQAESLRNLRRFTDNPDRLLLNRADVPCLPRTHLNPHNFRETLIAYCGLIRCRQSRWARDAALQLVRSMDRAIQPDGTLDCRKLGSWGHFPPPPQMGWYLEEKRDGWFDGTKTTGRALEALVWLFEATGSSEVLRLAERIARHHLAYSTSPDGTIRPEIVAAENDGHNHSYHGTLRGLLLYGLLTGQKTYVETVEATYRRAIRYRIVKESGWAPHDLGTNRCHNDAGDPLNDPATAGDSAQLALWLALRAGCDDLLDDVERLVRARILPSQMTDKEAERSAAARDRGAWGMYSAAHSGKNCVPDVHAAVVHTLCDIQQSIITRKPSGVWVNLHFDWEDTNLKITSRRDSASKLTAEVDRPETFMIRIPGWTPERSIRVVVDGTDFSWHRKGVHLIIPAERLTVGSRIEITYDLPNRRTEETTPIGRSYQFEWKGDEIIGVDPHEGPLPFYPPMEESSAIRLKEVDCFTTNRAESLILPDHEQPT